jgi:hypothetical protein
MPTINTRAVDSPWMDMLLNNNLEQGQPLPNGGVPLDSIQALMSQKKPPNASGQDIQAEYPEQGSADFIPPNYQSPQATINEKNLVATNAMGMTPQSSAPPQNPPMSFSASRSTRVPGVDTSGIDRLLRKMGSDDREGYKLQVDQINRMKALRDAMPTGSGGTDLSGLMALADNWQNNGGQFTKAYQRPETAMDRLSKINSVDENVLKAGQSMDKEARDALKDQLTGEVAKLHYSTELAKENAQLGKAKQLSATNVLNVNEGNTIPGVLDKIGQTLDENANDFGYGAALKGSEIGRLYDPESYNKYKTIDAQMKTASQSFGKFMEGGVLRKEDEEKYRNMFPQLSDTPNVARNKLSIIRDQMIAKQQSNLQALQDQGFDTRGLNHGFKSPGLPDALTGGQSQDPEISAIEAELKRRNKI